MDIIGSAVSGLANGILASPLFTRLADLIPDSDAKEKALKDFQLQLLDYASKSDLAQIAVNNTEAASNDRFVSGWRPFIGWVCGIAFFYHFMLLPFFMYICAVTHQTIAAPAFDMSSMNQVLFAMLGMSAFRTVEKFGGVAGDKK